MAVSASDVRKIASLARLQIDEAQLPVFVSQLNGILEHMEALQHADTSAAALAQPPEHPMPLRDDVVNPAPMRLSAEGLTSDTRDGFILVPRLSTHEDV